MKICLLDPGIENHCGALSSNLGDLIIQESVNRELFNIFENQEFIKLSTQAPLSKKEFELIRHCSLVFVGGTNLLSANMNEYNQWKVSLFDALRIRRAILLGVGWWQYQGSPNLYTKLLIKTALSNRFFHSVRDDYTKTKLQKIRLNVINTSCPTLWPLTTLNLDEIPYMKAQNVLLMLTDYNKNIDLDKKLLELLISKYEKVFFWPQGRGDKDYILNLNFSGTILEHSLEALDNFINSGISFDYIGTRLHGGIRCICAKKRSLILEVDNRAKEIAKTTNLLTIPREDLEFISKWINGSVAPKITLDLDSINQWKRQFSKLANGNLNLRDELS